MEPSRGPQAAVDEAEKDVVVPGSPPSRTAATTASSSSSSTAADSTKKEKRKSSAKTLVSGIVTIFKDASNSFKITLPSTSPGKTSSSPSDSGDSSPLNSPRSPPSRAPMTPRGGLSTPRFSLNLSKEKLPNEAAPATPRTLAAGPGTGAGGVTMTPRGVSSALSSTPQTPRSILSNRTASIGGEGGDDPPSSRRSNRVLSTSVDPPHLTFLEPPKRDSVRGVSPQPSSVLATAAATTSKATPPLSPKPGTPSGVSPSPSGTVMTAVGDSPATSSSISSARSGRSLVVESKDSPSIPSTASSSTNANNSTVTSTIPASVSEPYKFSSQSVEPLKLSSSTGTPGKDKAVADLSRSGEGVSSSPNYLPSGSGIRGHRQKSKSLSNFTQIVHNDLDDDEKSEKSDKDRPSFTSPSPNVPASNVSVSVSSGAAASVIHMSVITAGVSSPTLSSTGSPLESIHIKSTSNSIPTVVIGSPPDMHSPATPSALPIGTDANEMPVYAPSSGALQRLATASGHSDFFKIGDSKIAKPCNPHEAKVYCALMRVPPLLPFVARFHGYMQPPVATSSETQKRRFQTDDKFIILEDLTSGYSFPCVMDLKIGTKQYSSEDPSDKKKRRQAKASATTSAKMGVRLGGVRVYKPYLKTWFEKKGDYGKRLTEQGFQEAVSFFLNDGRRTRTELIMHFIEKLKEFLRALESQKTTFDFVASSVLLIYEGHMDREALRKPPPGPLSAGGGLKTMQMLQAQPLPPPANRVRADVRLIDFDHTVLKYEAAELQHEDCGATVGVRNLIKVFDGLLFSLSKTHSFTELPSLLLREEFKDYLADSKRQKAAPKKRPVMDVFVTDDELLSKMPMAPTRRGRIRRTISFSN